MGFYCNASLDLACKMNKSYRTVINSIMDEVYLEVTRNTEPWLRNFIGNNTWYVVEDGLGLEIIRWDFSMHASWIGNVK